MKVIFMGTPEFAVPSLRALIEKHEVTAVITQPDKPKGRGKKIIFSEVKQCALNNDIEVLQPIKIRDEEFIEKLKGYEADIFVVAAYGQILPESILYMPKYGSVNVHGSLLPKYRGAAPIQWAIINGETETGVTIMQMDKGMDTGDIILKKAIPIESDDNADILHDKLADVGAEALLEALEMIEKGEAKPIKQNSEKATYASMINKQTGKIDWNNNSIDIINLIRGLDPWPSAYTYYDGVMHKIWKVENYNKEYNSEPGKIVEIIENTGIVVKTKDGSLLIKELQMAGKKRMKASDYLRGNKVETGNIFTEK